MRHPLVAASMAGLLGMALAACGDSDSQADPRLGLAELTQPPPAVVARFADDVLWSVHTTGGSGQPGAPVPDYEVRADGTVFISTDEGLGVATFKLTNAGLDQVRDAFAPVSLDGDDYERSMTTDQPETTVYSTASGQPEYISVYGFDHDDLVDDDDWDRLADAIEELEHLTSQASGGTDADISTALSPYLPEEVALLMGPTQEAGRLWPFTQSLAADRLQWNGENACVVLRGRDVVRLRSVATEMDLDYARWSIERPSDGIPSTVWTSHRPVLRGTPTPCTVDAPDQISIGSFGRVRLGDPTQWTWLTPPTKSRNATAFELALTKDAVAEGAFAAMGIEPDLNRLWSYNTEWVTGTHNGVAYVEVRAVYPDEFRDDHPDYPLTWQVSVDVESGQLRAAKLDGHAVDVS